MDSCFTQIQANLHNTFFTNVSVDSLNGWAGVIAGNQVLLTNNAGFIPVGAHYLMYFCLPPSENSDSLTVTSQYICSGTFGFCDTTLFWGCIDSTCCESFDLFLQNVQNAISLTFIDSLCNGLATISGLPPCDSILSIDWGDGNVDGGSFGDGIYVHTYSQGGSLNVTLVVVEYDSLGKACFDMDISFAIELDCQPTATGESNSLSAPRIFPNPTTGQLYIFLPTPGEWTAELWSLDGKHLLHLSKSSESVNPWRLDLNRLMPGVYLIVLKKGGSEAYEWRGRILKM